MATSCLLTGPAAAQRIRGGVTQAAGGQPVVGAVVSAMDAADRAIISVATDTAGRYSLRWLPNAVALRVVRLGYRPNLARLPEGEPRDASIDVRLDQIVAMLEAAQVTISLRCPGSTDRKATLELWEQARAGLLAAVVARQQQARVAMVSYDREMDPRSKRVRRIDARRLAGASSRPYVAARRLDEFERSGFAEDRNGERTWYSPDADVLLDDRFAASHCFGVRAADAMHPGQFGLSFAPAPADLYSARVDVEGVLWVDPEARKLTQLEFFFTGPSTSVGRVRASGDITFTTVANGAVIISNWVIVIPNASRGTRPGASADVAWLNESGGFVAEAQWPDGTSWRSPLRPVVGQIVEENTNRPMTGAIVRLIGGSDSVLANASGVFELPLLPPGVYRLQATDTTLSRFLAPRSEDQVVTAGASRVEVKVRVKGVTAALRELCKDLGVTNSVALLGRLTRDRSVAGELRVEADWESKIKLDRDGRVSFEGNRSTFVLDREDRFAVCGVEPGRVVQLDLLILGRPVADTVVTVDKQVTTHEVVWFISSKALSDAAGAAATALVGTVLDDKSGEPIEGAEAWLVHAGEQFTANAAGRFEANGLRAGRHMIQVRRLGYLVLRDTVTLRFGVTATRQFRMVRQAQMLDTVTTTSTGVKYTSALLRGFEDRRATGVGRYVSEAELRQLDGQVNSWLKIFLRIPGTKVTTGTSGEHVESTRGTGGIGPNRNTPRADPNDIRSPRGCWVTIYLDGAPIYLSGAQRAPDMRTFQTTQFAGVEYYAGDASLPAQFSGIRATECGVLLLWTRER